MTPQACFTITQGQHEQKGASNEKIIRTIMAVFLIISCFLTIAIPAQAAYFTDVSRSTVDSETLDAINYMADNGYMVGTSSTQFSPNLKLTRAMFVAILYRYSGTAERYTNSFTDVPSGAYYYDAVGWAAHYNIVAGVTETQFAPNSNITREQALTFLYRYATRYKGMTFSNLASISTHPDKSNISSYAVTPVCWAMAYHVFQLSSPKDYIYPKQIVTRGETALYMARFSWFIDKLSVKERFNFGNNGDYFYSDSYGKPYMNSFSRNRLYALINAYYGAGTTGATAAWDRMLSQLRNEWRGSCHGMSMCVLLDKQGKIDFNRNFSNKYTMSAVPNPKDNLNVESTINFYQIACNLGDGQYNSYSIANKNISTGANNFVAHVRNYGLTIFNYFYTANDDGEIKTFGHSVIASSITFNAANNCYYVSVIDPNVPGSTVTRALKISSSGVTFNGKNITLLSYYTQKTIDFWDNYDIDGSYNNINRIPANERGVTTETTHENTESETLYQNDTALIMVPFVPFEIENEMGEKLICDGESISGNMDVLETQVSPNGSDAAAELSLRVAASKQFTFHASGDNATYFFVTTPQYYGGASGENLNYISVNSDRTVYVNGSNINYDAIVALDEERTGYISACGSSENGVTLQASDNHVDITGVEESCLSYYCNGGDVSTPVKIAGSSAGFSVNVSVSEEAVTFYIIDKTMKDSTYSASWTQ